MRPLQCRLGEKDTVIGNNAHRVAVNMGETADQGGTVQGLELGKFAAVHNPRYDFTHLERLARVRRDYTVYLLDCIFRFHRLPDLQTDLLTDVKVSNGASCQFQGMPIVQRIVIRHAGLARMYVRAAQIFRADHLACCRLDQGRTAEKYRSLVFDDDALVGHGRHIGAAGGAGAHDHGKLRNAPGRQVGLVVEDAAEVVPVREYLVLFRQKRAAGIHQVDTRQMVHPGNFLGAQVLLHRERVIGAALDGGIVSHDHTLAPCHAADAGDDPRGRHGIVIHAPGGKLGQFQERRARVAQVPYTVAREQFAAGLVFLPGFIISAPGHDTGFVVQVFDQGAHGGSVGLELPGLSINRSF